MTDPADRLLAMMARVEPRFRRRFLEVVRTIKSRWTLSQIEGLLATGQAESALVVAEMAAVPLGRTWGDVYILSGDETAAYVGNALDIVVNFDTVNTRALATTQANQLRLVREFGRQQRLATREALVDGMRRGLNPRDTARAFRDSIGLTERQVRAVGNYRRLLETNSRGALARQLRDRRYDPAVRRATVTGAPLDSKKVDMMVGRYRERYLKYRSEVIARTESLRAAHAGSEELYAQAIDNGTLRADELARQWVTARDERVRGSHAPMHGQRQPVGQPFVSGSGHMLLYPGDPNAPGSESIQCRCAVTTRFS